MEDYRFYHPISVRYGDMDAHRHVNNARYFTYMEDARVQYIKHLGLWDGEDFDHLGFILLETTCTFKTPAKYGQQLRVGAKTVRLGTKSMEIHNSIEDAETGLQVAVGRSILVTYDYTKDESIPIPERWRSTIMEFEGD